MASTTYVVQGVLTETVADTFIQATLNTGLAGSDNTAFRIKEFILEHPLMAANGAKSEVQLTRGPKAAIINYADPSLIFKDERYMYLATNGAVLQEQIKDIVPQGDLIIVEPQIYLGFKTLAAGAVSIGYKVIFEEIKITTDQRLAIFNSRLP